MIKHGIDQEALISKFSEASAKQGEAIRKAVTETTLKALQGRELTLSNIKQVLNTVAKAASTGAAGSALPPADVETLLGKAVAGMDAALEKAVQANRKALQQIVEQGADLRETQVKKALADIEKMEDTLFAALRKAADGSQASLERALGASAEGDAGQGHGHRRAGERDHHRADGQRAGEPAPRPCARRECVAGDARQLFDARERRADRHVRRAPARRRGGRTERVAQEVAGRRR
jgi:hypothetical protein